MIRQIEVQLDCGIFGEQDVIVRYDYTPYEPASCEDPGQDEDFEVTGIFIAVGESLIALPWPIGNEQADEIVEIIKQTLAAV